MHWLCRLWIFFAGIYPNVVNRKINRNRRKGVGFFSRELYITRLKTNRAVSRSTGYTKIEQAEFSMWTQIALSDTNLASPVALMKRKKKRFDF